MTRLIQSLEHPLQKTISSPAFLFCSMIARMTDQPIPSNNPNLVDSLLHPQSLIIRQLLTRPGRIELNKILIDDEENIRQALDAGVEIESIYYAGDEIVSVELKKKLSLKVKIFDVAKRTTKK